MDRFQAMQAFTRIVELGAFGKAADSLELPRASVTQAIQQLEAHLGVQLLQRTTRQVSLTLDGQAYYERCVRLLADLEEAESCFPRVLNNPRGRLRVDLPGALGRMRVIPFLPEFCERYPELELQLSSNDRLVDLPQVTCASAAYLERHGHPRQLAELGGHLAVNYQSPSSGRTFDFEFSVDGRLRTLPMRSRVSVNNADAYVAACRAGLGLIQAPHYHVAAGLADGSLRQVLGEWLPPPLPLHAVYPSQRQLSPRVRVFVDWLVELFGRQAAGETQ
ncbi:TPA: LysR family transcriptional regulator [Pseudomonas aeruginosa]|uniref:LysR family transcriptional regulator n=1 Tax=Pseudomonas aeruginosa TaxID=287 RepID=UPI001573C2B7|nr:LysR family transcriptional regulator [Pseudomonas aeruginosa]NTT92249.1 LysR family transcriptional regulator [Pseudomonas aeruginosa]HCF3159342.1 LysR family transcriptional regulator [Pseudomonas aeruginosa]HDR2968265.1 LysR family transcriptional regulator [Pseudomonas aeruginosa]